VNKPKWVVVFDFDGTLTSKNLVSLFDVIDRAMPEEHMVQLKLMRDKYIKKAHAGLLTKNEESSWFFETVDLYVRAGLSISKIEEVMHLVRLRNGVVECLKWLKCRHIPVAIISYGVAQFIEAALKSNDALHLVSRIYAGKLIIDSIGLVKGLNTEYLVFPSNKGAYSRRFSESFSVSYRRILAVGDSGSDAKLGYLKENRFGITNNEVEAEKLKNCMGGVVITENFEPVSRWLAEKINLE